MQSTGSIMDQPPRRFNIVVVFKILLCAWLRDCLYATTGSQLYRLNAYTCLGYTCLSEKLPFGDEGSCRETTINTVAVPTLSVCVTAKKCLTKQPRGQC